MCDARRFRQRIVTLQPLETMKYRRADWVDTFVIVEAGNLEIECQSGARASFGRGAMLALAGLNLRLLRNTDCDRLVLRALSRVRTDE